MVLTLVIGFKAAATKMKNAATTSTTMTMVGLTVVWCVEK
jgi:hypothetical protein